MTKTKLSQREVNASFEGDHLNICYPPVMTVEQLGRMLHVSRSMIYAWTAEGKLDFAKVRPGPGVRFWRDRIIKWYFGHRSN